MTAAWCDVMQGEYVKAWNYLVEANRRQRDTYSFNPEASCRLTTAYGTAYPCLSSNTGLLRLRPWSIIQLVTAQHSPGC